MRIIILVLTGVFYLSQFGFAASGTTYTSNGGGSSPTHLQRDWDTDGDWDNGSPGNLGSNNDLAIVSAWDSVRKEGDFVLANKQNGITVKANGILIIDGDFDVQNNLTITIEPGGKFEITGDMDMKNNSDVTINGDMFIGGNLTVGGGSTTWSGTGNLVIGGTGCDQVPDPFGSSGNCTDVLPITLGVFSVDVNSEQQAVLSWTTESELNNDYFEIQRSHDAVEFETIGEIKGAGSTKNLVGYTYRDTKPLDGISYYRLKQTDFDGVFQIHRIIALDNTQIQHEEIFLLYPNPTSGQQFFTIAEDVVLYGLELSSLIGERVLNFDIEEVKSSGELNYTDVKIGLYVLHVSTSVGEFDYRVVLK